jgi:lipopolysaccharide transport system ATP-binding protein
MSDVILSVENVSKLYRLGTVGTGTFGGDVQRFWKTKILGQEDPFLKIGKTNDRTSKEKAEFVWALQDINFEVKRGEVLGIIGKNGAGKSTLLKLLSRITSPTTGSIKSAGRMASLLEVGTGFHPELTGRENIFLNGAILGMTKKEIQSKFDEIVDFSGCELYIDTPTKRYSSGMTVRLGFAVAAFLDPEILVVDEVLAVGDAEFQKKAIGKMKEVSESGGRTVLFVSHNMESIKSLCTSGVLIENGKVGLIGEISQVVDKYLETNLPTAVKGNYSASEEKKDLKIQILEVELITTNNNFKIDHRDDIEIEISYIVNNDLVGSNIALILKKENVNILWSFDTDKNYRIFEQRKAGRYKTKVKIPRFLLKSGIYHIDISSGIQYGDHFENLLNCLIFEIINKEDNLNFKSYNSKRGGLIGMPLDWCDVN